MWSGLFTVAGALSVTYYVALPFVRAEDGCAAGQALECQSAPEANNVARSRQRRRAVVHALGRSKLGEFRRRDDLEEVRRRAG